MLLTMYCRGQDDVQIFDFSSRQESKEEFKFIKDERTNHYLPVALVGDALVEPFWPVGTGANRAVLSALDVTWVVKHFFEVSQIALPPAILSHILNLIS